MWWVLPTIAECCTAGNAGDPGTCGTLGYDDWAFNDEDGGTTDCFVVHPLGENGPDECYTEGSYNCTVATAPAPDTGPILITFSGRPQMSSLQAGVLTDLVAAGRVVRASWPTGIRSGWLVLDRNGNGVVDGRGEMFSGATRLSSGRPAGNGFRALSEYDTNGDGVLDPRDDVWPRLRVWLDRNHDGTSDQSELITLRGSGIRSISTKPQRELRTDSRRNRFSLKSLVLMADGEVRWAHALMPAHRTLGGTLAAWYPPPCGANGHE